MKKYFLPWFDGLIAPHPDEAGFSVWLQEEARAERVANVLRILYLIVWLAMTAACHRVNEGEPNTVNLVGGALWFFSAVLYHAYLRRRSYRPTLKYFSLSADLLFSFGMYYLYRFDVPGAPTTLKSPTFMNVFLILALSALRFNAALPVYGGVLALTLYGGVVLALVRSGIVVFGNRFDMVTTAKVNPVYLSFNAAYVATFTVVLVALVRQARRLVRLRSEETERALAEKHARDQMRTTLERYFTPQVARHLLENPQALGGRLQEATIVVADVRNFTRLSESLGPEKTVQFLNALFEKMIGIVFKHGGTLDKFLGDGMLIAFGVPHPHPDDALRAMRAAVEMVGAAETVGDWTGVTLGCAIHSGEVLMGNVGAPSRMEFTVIGDVVNTACRMEQFNKQFQTAILLSHVTYERLKDGIEARAMPSTGIRGKSEPVYLYEFIAWKTPTTEGT